MLWVALRAHNARDQTSPPEAPINHRPCRTPGFSFRCPGKQLKFIKADLAKFIQIRLIIYMGQRECGIWSVFSVNSEGNKQWICLLWLCENRRFFCASNPTGPFITHVSLAATLICRHSRWINLSEFNVFLYRTVLLRNVDYLKFCKSPTSNVIHNS